VFRSQSDDRRQSVRSPANTRGVVVAPGLELPCVIADTSDGGLKLRLDRALVLPEAVTVVDIAAGVAIEARVAWRQGTETGLKRTGQASLRGLVPSRLLPAREAWLRAGAR
jgi:hypothetical protein